MPIDFSAIEKKWQREWEKSGIARAEPKKGKKKFYLIFAYPGISGFLHVGHMRGYTYSDVITRYKRMQGYNVLFPAGFHASGLPAVAYAAKVKRKDLFTIEQLKEYGLSASQIKELEDPLKVVEFYSKIYVDDFWKPFGFLIDFDRKITTIQPEYNRFIEWQFKKLKQKGLLIQKPHFAPHCPQDGPVAIDSSETDIARGGNAETMEYIVLKFRFKEFVFPAATLRPETIYGVTNMWLNPDSILVVANYNNEQWLFTEQAAEKMKYQKEKFEITSQKIPAKELIGKKCFNPATETGILVLPGPFVDSETGTGIVMSVPSHAPYDWMALKDLQENPKEAERFGVSKKELLEIKPVSLINAPGYGEHPAIEECEKLGIKSQQEVAKLEEATKNVYSAEFHQGRLKWMYKELEGEKVSEAKEKLVAQYREKNWADSMHGFSEKVVCRCGRGVVIKLVPDQWFIRYSDKELTKKSIEQSKKMAIWPEEYKQQMPAVLDWFSDRACVRQGSWLGTRFPFDQKWIIEPISDSTLYPLTYLYSKFVNEKKLKAENLTEEFFDFVFLGKGKAPAVAKNCGVAAKLLQQIREEFLYWYPLDINLGGKEHKTVHFPVFLMNHVAVLNPEHWPKGIFVNWWIVGETGKISKSKGGAVSLHDLAKRFSVDALRLYYCNIGNPHMDVTFSEETSQKYRNSLERIAQLAEKAVSTKKSERSEGIDAWLEEKSNRQFALADQALNELKLKEFSETVYYLFPLDLKWYFQRGGSNPKLLKKMLEQWIVRMAPITPHVAEEMWHAFLKNTGLVSMAAWPKTKAKINRAVLQAEATISQLLEDIEKIKQLAKIEKPKRIIVFPAPNWKWRALQLVLKENPEKPDFKKTMASWMQNPELKAHGNEAAAFVQRVLSDIGSMREWVKVEEAKVLKKETGFLESRFECKVEIEAESSHPKAQKAFPTKPAILIE